MLILGDVLEAKVPDIVKNLVEDWSAKLKEAYETRIFVQGIDDSI